MIYEELAIFTHKHDPTKVGATEDAPLAYMCSPTKKNMMKTGAGWASSSRRISPQGSPYESETIPADLGIYKNVPTKGLKIVAFATRYTTQNVVWRVEDPRGFTLEIYSGNMEGILADCDIIKGVIQGECVWGRGTVPVLLPVTSDLYAKHKIDTANRTSTIIKAKDLIAGSKYKMVDGSERVFIGSSHYVTMHIGEFDLTPSKSKVKFSYKIYKERNHRLDMTRSTFKAIELLEEGVDMTSLATIISDLGNKVCYNYCFLTNRAKPDTMFTVTKVNYEDMVANKLYVAANSNTMTDTWFCVQPYSDKYQALTFSINRNKVTNFNELLETGASSIQVDPQRYSYSYSRSRNEYELDTEKVYEVTITIDGKEQL